MIKDTMMSPADIEAIMLPKNSYIMPVELGKCMDLIEAQAEITGRIMKQAGREEVVEWMREHKYHGIGEIIIKRKEYEAKLKEWGISNE